MEPPDGTAPERTNGRLPVPSVPAAPIGTGPVPEDVRPAEETIVEVDGLLITLLPGGRVALVDSHPDGATSVVSLDRRRMEALAPFLRGRGPAEQETAEPEHDPEPEAGPTSETGPSPVKAPAPEDGPAAEGADSPEVDWDLYDEQLKAAFLLEQYASGVAPDDLPPGWEAILAALPAALTRRSRRTRDSGPGDVGRPEP